jgi:predicted nucleic acid-binding protein
MIAGFASDRGASYAVLMLASLQLLQLVVCPYLVEEMDRNIAKKLPVVLPRYDAFKTQVQWEVMADPPDDAVANWLDIVPAKDAPVIAAAILARPYCLLTLDHKHLIKPLEVAQRSPVKILRPGELLREVRVGLSRHLSLTDMNAPGIAGLHTGEIWTSDDFDDPLTFVSES